MRVFFVAGEASGDSHAAAVARELRKLEPSVEIEALGGPRLQAEGVTLTEDFVEHATMGLFPVLAKLPTFVRIMRETLAHLKSTRPDVVVPVDYPGFNLRLSRRLKNAGIPVCFYVSPQVWAWNPGRIHKIGRSIDHMMVLFDFETKLYKDIGTPVSFVGHPLFDSLHDAAKGSLRDELGLDNDTRLVGLLPGSRRQEIQRILPEILRAAHIVYAKRKNLHFALPVAKDSLKAQVLEILEREGQGLPITVLDGRSHDVMKGSYVVMTASGTATLELAFFKTPMVIIYKVTRFQKLFIPILGIGLIGLVNILYGRELCLEFLDAEDRSEDIAAEVLRLLHPGKRRKAVLNGLKRVRKRIAVRGTATRAAECILEVARRHRAERESS